MTNDSSYKTFTQESGGRAGILFLLFLIAMYSMYTSGIAGLAIVCMIPVMIIGCYLVMKYDMFLFYILLVINYFLHFINRYNYMPVPMSLPNELIELMLIAVAMLKFKHSHLRHTFNVMGLALGIWVVFCCLEVFNDQCGLGIDIANWFTGTRLMAFQLVYPFIVFCLFIDSPEKIEKSLYALVVLSVIGALWAFKQREIGFTATEKAFLVYAARTHIVNGVTRYFSVFSDAANFGIHMASISVIFILCAITTPLKRKKIMFGLLSGLCIWAMFLSGTRTSIFCLFAGLGTYLFLSKSIKIVIPFSLFFALFVCFMAFTTIGNSNSTIRRMRSAFNKNDASLGVRDINKAALKKYMVDAPWGIGIGKEAEDVPAYSKFKIVSQIPPDSEYVYIWVRTGKIGITVFIISTLIMFLGACWNVLFRIKNKSLCGIGAGFTCAFVSLHLGGYANQVLLQYPNVIIFYGGLSLVYILPYLDKEYTEWENKLLAEQEERKRLKLEKKRASRV